MSSKDLNVAKKINQLSKNIRKKYLALKLGRTEEDQTLQKLYKPIISSIENITKAKQTIAGNNSKTSIRTLPVPIKQTPTPSTLLIQNPTAIKQSPSTLLEPSIQNLTTTNQSPTASWNFPQNSVTMKQTPIHKKQYAPRKFLEEDVFSREDDNFDGIEKSDEERGEEYEPLKIYSPQVYAEYLDAYPKIARSYIDGFLHDSKNKFYDKTYGIRHDAQTEKWLLGKSVVNFESKSGNIKINDKTYNGTNGLYELLFMKQPENYTADDIKNYQDILKSTNVHKRDYDPKGQLRGTNQTKYLEIIRPLVQEKLETRRRLNTYSGCGIDLLKYNSKPIEYIYWDDPNELVDRLRLLIAEKSAGNTSHDNEIISILNELKEEGVVY